MAKKKQKNGRLLFIISAISTVTVLLVGYMILVAYGEKSGVEFSPDDFSMRKFNYCRLPLINWTKRGIEYTDVENATAESLIQDDWIRETGRKPKRWHLVSESGGFFRDSGKLPAECDARFLTSYFDLSNEDGETLVIKWTDENPKSAKMVWPLIADMARGNLYLLIPDIFEFVLDRPEADKDENFASEFRVRVSESWYQAGLTDQLKGEHDRAIERFNTALAVNEDHPSAEQARLKSEAASQ
jgi:hypothetical protein